MDNLKQKATHLGQIWKVFWAWLCKSPRNVVIAASVFLAVVVGLVLFIRIVLPTLVVIVAFVVIFTGEKIVDYFKKEPEAEAQLLPPIESVIDILMDWAYRVTVHLKTALPSPIRMPTGQGETRGSPPIATIIGVKRFLCYVPLDLEKQDKEIDLADVKEVIQAGFNNLLAEGQLPEQPRMLGPGGVSVPILSVDGERIVTIADISREKLRLVVTGFWVNNATIAAHVRSWRKGSTPPVANEGGGSYTDKEY